jgi:hypothetical protein
MNEIQQPPRPQLVRVADLLDEGILRYLDARSNVRFTRRREAPIEASALSALCIRNVETVTLLARTDEVFAPAAWNNSRTAFEVSARIIWLLHPGDRFESEMRWIALVREYERFHRRMAEGLTSDTIAVRHRELRDDIGTFIAGVEQRVPKGYSPAPGIPSVEAMMKEIKNSNMYAAYVESSQYSHGTMAASAVYRRGLGTELQLGEFVTALDWIMPLRVCWLSFREMSRFVVDRLSSGAAELDWRDFSLSIDAAFRDLALTV